MYTAEKFESCNFISALSESLTYKNIGNTLSKTNLKRDSKIKREKAVVELKNKINSSRMAEEIIFLTSKIKLIL